MSECPNVGIPRCRNVRLSECPNVQMSECPNVCISECPGVWAFCDVDVYMDTCIFTSYVYVSIYLASVTKVALRNGRAVHKEPDGSRLGSWLMNSDAASYKARTRRDHSEHRAFVRSGNTDLYSIPRMPDFAGEGQRIRVDLYPVSRRP